MNVYLIYGNDYSLIKREVDKISLNANDVVKYDLSVDKVDNLLDDASCMSLLDEKKVIIGENALFLTSLNTNVNHNLEYLSNYVNDENHDNIIVLTVVTDKLDERKKIVKLLKQKAKVIHKYLIEDKNLNGFVMDEFKNAGYKMDLKTANYFVSYVGKNVDILVSEIEKMIVYKDNNKIVTINDINEISSRGFKDNVFDLTDAITKRDFKKMYECYNDLMVLGEEPVKIIALLGNQFLLIYQVKLLNEKGKSNTEISQILNVHPYRVKLALETDFLTYELKDILKKLHDLDFGIKSGSLDKNHALEDFLLHL